MKPDSRVGSQVAGYRLQALLGRGGMGSVYVAEDPRLGRKIALKLLAPELGDDERFRERFLRESRLAAAIEHPNIVPIHQAGEHDGVLYIAMRYVEGTDARRLLAESGGLEAERAVAIVEQAAAALDAAHERGLVHRDVKPANILLDRGGHVYLADFGLTKQTSSVSGLTGTGQLVGTVDYVPPEQVKGEQLDARADVYSLGCVLYELLAGEPPFRRENDVATLWAHVQEPPPSLVGRRPDLPAELDAVMARALAKDPADRYGSAGELARDVRQRLVRSPAGAAGRPTRRRPLRKLRVGRLAVVALLAAALVVAAAAALLAGGDSAVTVPPNSVAIIDPGSDEVVGWAEVGADPTEVAAAGETVWVLNGSDQTLSLVNAASEREEDVIPLRNLLPWAIAANDRVAWVVGTEGTSSRVVRVDPSFGDVAETRELRDLIPGTLAGGSEAPGAVSWNAGRLWVAGPGGDVYRLDPVTLETLDTFAAPGVVRALAAAGDVLWAVVGSGVLRIDVRDETSEHFRVAVGLGPISVALGGGAAWVASPLDDLVSRIEFENGTISGVPVGDTPADVIFAFGSVWVANTADGTVSRIDPERQRVTATIPVGRDLGGLAAVAGKVWVVAR